MPAGKPKYRRVILKISGEGFCRSGQSGIDQEQLQSIARQIADVVNLNVQTAVVVGGGNFIRGATIAQQTQLQPATAHYMGMLATVLNGLALQDTLEALDIATRLQSAINISAVCEPFIRRRCIRHLEKDRTVILSAGTGNPFVTTDTCAALRATEISADVLLKATKVDGVFDKDPVIHPDAKRFDRLTYDEVIDRRLKVMDVSAIDLCQQHRVPIVVFNLTEPGNMRRVVMGESVGTLVSD
ncbi:MAG TPA: UMP kinase [Phycisphaerae bacterium]|nr:UMP kinase [Phycisphaerae bacterium]